MRISLLDFIIYTEYVICAAVSEVLYVYNLDESWYSKILYNKFTNIRQHNNYLLEHIGYMFRPVNRSSSGLQQNKSKVPLEN